VKQLSKNQMELKMSHSAIIYIRVSTTEQHLSVENQLSRLQSYAVAHGFINSKIIVDEGISGKSAKNRPGFQEMMSLVPTKQYSDIIVYSLSRFARSVKDTIEAVEILKKNDIKFHSFSENIDTSTAAGIFFLTMLSALAEMESNQLAERVRSVMQHRKSQGFKVGAVPHGKKEVNGKLQDDPYEQETIAIIKKLHGNKLTFGKIAKELEKQGRLNKKGQARWQPNMIKRIIAAK
ncbi:MAG: recombinase family protein, partial [Methanococcaceae archaeon]